MIRSVAALVRAAPKAPSTTGYVLGFALSVGGAGMVAAAAVSALYREPDAVPLIASGGGVLVLGLVIWTFCEVPRLRTADVFPAVAFSWIGLSLASTIAYLATGTFDRFDNALFESISGFTTTGATLLQPIKGNSHGILLWRSMTQWVGGMGVIVLAVAVLPFLGVGGLELIRAEAPGPSSERLVPRVRETAKRLWILYVGFTIAVAAAYALGGMRPYDAVNHAFTTVSTGGFSPYDASLAHFSSPVIEWIAIVAMAVAAGNFTLYWRMLRGQPLSLLHAPEFRVYALLIAGFCGVAILWNTAEHGLSHDVVRGSIFSVVSVSTTTGYTTVDFAAWAPAPQLVLLFAMALGGMTGSTAGGLKVFRLMGILQYARRQIHRELHPRAIRMVRMGAIVIPETVVARVIGFFGLFMAIGAIATFVVAALGADILTSISAAATAIGNVGPGLGEIGPTGHFLSLPPTSRAVLMVTMLIGRLEIYPVLLSLTVVVGGLAGTRLRPLASTRRR